MNNKLKKWLSIGTISIFIVPNLCQAAYFTDVPKSDRFYDAIEYLYQNDITKGYEDGTFKTEKLVSKAEFLKLIFRHAGYQPEINNAETRFTDVPPNSWFAPYVKKALDLGIVSYSENLHFQPSEPITRLEALKIIMPLEGIPVPYNDTNTIISFSDVPDEVPYSYIIKAAQNSGLYFENEKRFNPFNPLTRGELAYLIYRAEIFRETFGYSNSDIPVNNEEENHSEISNAEMELLNNPKFPIFMDVWSRINQSYMNKEDVDTDELIYTATKGMVESLGDEYSIFESPETAKDIENNIEGTFEGVGIVLDEFNGKPIVMSVIKTSPAEKAGLKAGDIITKVNDTSTEGKTINDVSDMIKGEAGTSVKLEIKRNNQTSVYTIKREKLSIDTVILEQGETVKIPENIGYLSIYQFTEKTGSEFNVLLKTTLSKNPKGLILDLRDNPGGYLTSANSVIGHFVSDKDVTLQYKIGNEYIKEYSKGLGEVKEKKIPVIVLVNGGSASAAEVVAGALQDYKVAKLLGEKTYGKGTVQEITNYTDGSFFKLSIAHWLTPLKRDIDKVGLIPDIEVKETSDDAIGKTDSQLERAIQELQKLM